MASLHDDSDELLYAVASYAPSGNVRIAMLQLLEFLAEMDPENMEIDARLVKEILARGLISLGFGGEDLENGMAGHEEEFERRGYSDYSELTPTEVIEQFRIELGLDGEDDDKKEN